MRHIGTFEVERESIVVLYETSTGRIVHLHNAVTVNGGKHPDQKTVERDALEQLSLAQPGLKEKVDLLQVDPSSLKPRTLYKVDTKKRVLIETDMKRQKA
jgi:hypothetical protein